MKFLNYYKGNLDFLLEFTVKDFRTSVPSKRNKEWLKKRQEGNTGSNLIDVIWNNKKDTLLLKYKTVPTPTDPIKNVSKKGNVSSGNIYDIEVLFEKVKDYLGTKKEFLKLNKGTQTKRIRDLVKNAKIRVHSNAPDFLFQGGWMRSIENDYNIYPMPSKRNKDKGIWKKRHEGKNEYITKGILEVIKTIPFIVSSISKSIREKYK